MNRKKLRSEWIMLQDRLLKQTDAILRNARLLRMDILAGDERALIFLSNLCDLVGNFDPNLRRYVEIQNVLSHSTKPRSRFGSRKTPSAGRPTRSATSGRGSPSTRRSGHGNK